MYIIISHNYVTLYPYIIYLEQFPSEEYMKYMCMCVRCMAIIITLYMVIENFMCEEKLKKKRTSEI